MAKKGVTQKIKLGSDKDVQAWTNNAKEKRVLEKKLQTISLEEDYAIKLLELSSREVKVNNKRLKGKVSKIKSYLSPDEIIELRNLDLEGKLKAEYNQVNVNGAIRIAAAAKRLKMDSVARAKAVTVSSARLTPRPSAKMASNTPQVRVSLVRAFIDEPQSPDSVKCFDSSLELSQPVEKPPPNTKVLPESPMVHSHSSLEIGNQVSKHRTTTFASPESTRRHSESAMEISHSEPRSPTTMNAPPQSALRHSISSQEISRPILKHPAPIHVSPQSPLRLSNSSLEASPSVDKRPATTHGCRREFRAPISARTPRSISVKELPTNRPRSKSVYSSHNVSVSSSNSQTPSLSSRRMSVLSDDSIENKFTNTKQIVDEQRKEMLEKQILHTQSLKDQQTAFLARITSWIKESHPSVKDAYLPATNNNITDNVETVIIKKDGKPLRRLTGRVNFSKDNQRKAMSLEERWKDLNKCRYLRISEDIVDLSGVVTLARDQMRLALTFSKRDDDE